MKSPYKKLILPGIFALIGLILVIIPATGLVRFFKIPTNGMAPTVSSGDYVLATKSGKSPSEFQRGEIVIFAPSHDSKSRYIQRIVALPGDTIEHLNGHLAVNGEPLESPDGTKASPANQSVPDMSPPSYPVTLSTDEVFVLGDNYDNSLDSRYFGPIKFESITHIPKRIALPLSRGRSLSSEDSDN
ncbi:MAG: signal peptidase I [Verrucomicrobiota bacterium]